MGTGRPRSNTTPAAPGPDADTPRTPAPLEGVRVLDLTRVVSGPVCTKILAQLGAEVIRLDRPGGDVVSSVPPFLGRDGQLSDVREGDDISLSYAKHNVGKRNVALDIFSEEGREVFRSLVVTADVLVENFRPAVMSSLGLGHEDLRELRPELIYCAITGYGHSGPYRDRHGMDLLVQASSGLMAMTGFPDGPPVKSGAWLGDNVPAAYAALGILAALLRRSQTGEGDFVDISMHDVLTSVIWDSPLDLWRDRGRVPRTGNADPRAAPMNVYPCVDGWFALMVMDDGDFAGLCGEIGRSDLAEDLVGMSRRAAHADAIDAAISEWSSTRTTDEVLAALHRLDCPAARVNDPWHGDGDPHTESRGVLGRLMHSEAAEPSRYRTSLLPIRFASAPTRPVSSCEPPGHSTDDVLDLGE